MNRKFDNSMKSEFDKAFILSEDETLSSTRQSISDDSINSTIVSEFNKKIEPMTTFFANLKTVEKKVELKPKIIGNEILLDRYDLTTIKGNAPKTILSNLETKSEENIVTNSVKYMRESCLWPALTMLDDTLNSSNDNIADDNLQIMQRLNERFFLSPKSFSESLMTILEESLLENYEKSVGSSKSLTDLPEPSKISKHKTPILHSRRMKPDEVPIDNSWSDGYKYFVERASAMKDILENETPPIPITVTSGDSQNSTRNWSADDESTKYYDLPNIETMKKSPKIIIDPPTPVRIMKKTPRARLFPTASTISKEKKSKVRFNQEELEEIPTLRKQPFLSPYNSDEDDYLTAESETDDSEASKVSTRNTNTESSIDRSDISKIASKHQEWVKKFEEVSRQQSFNITSKQKKLSEYTNKLEKIRLKELNDKRQKCFDLVNEILEKHVDFNETNVAPRSSNSAKLTPEFSNVLQAFGEFFQYGQSLIEISEVIKNSTPRYVSRTSIRLHPRKSIGKSLGKSPDSRTGTVSTKLTSSSVHSKARRSIGLGATGKTRKSANKLPSLKEHDTCSMHLSPSLNNAGRKKKLKSSPVVDTSSLRPVSQVRKIFSPDTKTTDGLQVKETSGKLKEKKTRKKPVTKLVLKPLRSKDVVSPVGQYIRGGKKA